ncbi:MAG: glycosyltransferase, partial [Candidatus Pacearchaeota archaeon]|nr:glycosyltransferase [Candidatus Pacearchaeota archaeon]
SNIAKKYASKNDKIKLYKMDRNFGAPSCMNFGTKKAKYNWVGIIDSDATESKDWLKKANEIVEDKIDLFGGGVNYTKDKNLSYLQNVYYYIETNLFLKKEVLYNLDNFKEPPIAGANFFYKKEVFNNLRGFKKEIKAGYDRLFICQAIENGFNVVYNNQLSINHPLYNYKNLKTFFRRAINFNKNKTLIIKESKLIAKEYKLIPISLLSLLIYFVISFIFLGLKRTIILSLIIGCLGIFIYSLKLFIKDRVPLKYIPGYTLVDFLKKSIASIIYLLKLKPKNLDWKDRSKK